MLAVAVLAVYSQTFSFGYVLYDDNQYVYENPIVKAGLSWEAIGWALKTFSCGNWHPLTWISYMLDFQIFGPNAGEQHAVNVLMHLASTLLLFLTLLRMTNQPWRCAFVSGIFALHPSHVESVAWIAERKDILCTLFVMLSLLMYVRYAKAPSAARYLAVAMPFALSLTAKPMAVTVPFVLLLLDYWPLRRLSWPVDWRELGRLVREKALLLGMSAAGSVLTFIAQKSSGAVIQLERLPLSTRIANAIVTYVGYIGKAIWPADLAVFYPIHRYRPETILAALLVLIALTVAAVVWARRRPYLLAGWLWYVGMLVPVIGIVQVGAQAMADRYTYLPFIGLSIALVWTAGDALERRPSGRRAAVAVSIVALASLAAVAFHQAAYWRNSHTLFEHALTVTKQNYVIQNNLGIILGREGRSSEAVSLYREAIAANPDYADGQINLGRELMKTGQLDEALSHLTEAVRLGTNQPAAYADLGQGLAAEGKFEESERYLEVALRLIPPNAELHNNLCFVLQRLGRLEDARAHCEEALKLKPNFPEARFNLGTALATQGQKAEAVHELTLVPHP